MNIDAAFDKLFEHIEDKIELTEEEILVIKNSFTFEKVKKRQYISQPNYINKHRSYVVEGAFRSFLICIEGQDHTIQFAIDDWWIMDMQSYFFQEPATMFIMALQDSSILKIDFETEQRIKRDHRNIESFFRIIAERTLPFMQQRITANLTENAKKRYEIFIEKYPEIVQRVPQYALASYLGITTEYLSRLRNNKV